MHSDATRLQILGLNVMGTQNSPQDVPSAALISTAIWLGGGGVGTEALVKQRHPPPSALAPLRSMHAPLL